MFSPWRRLRRRIHPDRFSRRGCSGCDQDCSPARRCGAVDMAANATGHRRTDHLKIMALAEAAADFAREVLAPGAFLCKVLQEAPRPRCSLRSARLHRCARLGGAGGAICWRPISRPRVALLSPRMPAAMERSAQLLVGSSSGRGGRERRASSAPASGIARERECRAGGDRADGEKGRLEVGGGDLGVPARAPSARPPARRWRRRSRSTPAGRPPPARWRGSCGGCRRRRRRWC